MIEDGFRAFLIPEKVFGIGCIENNGHACEGHADLSRSRRMFLRRTLGRYAPVRESGFTAEALANSGGRRRFVSMKKINKLIIHHESDIIFR